MRTLAETQRALWEVVRAPEGAPPSAHGFRGSARFPAAAGLEVYRVAYWLRHVRALESTYPRTRHALGEKAFAGAARRYIEVFPSQQGELELAGAAFPEWLRAAHGRETADLAAFELASFRVLVAPNEALVPLEAVTPDTFATSTLTLGSHVRTVRLARSVLCTLGHDRATTSDAALVVWRRDFSVRHREIADAENAAIEAASRGAAVSELCARMAPLGDAGEDGAAPVVFRTLSAWFRRGWVVSLSRERR